MYNFCNGDKVCGQNDNRAVSLQEPLELTVNGQQQTQ